MDENGFYGIIKDEVKVNFGKGDPRVGLLLQAMEALQLNPVRYRTIHPSTLKSQINEIMEKGEIQIPLADLRIHEYTISKIKPKKVKKQKL
jgi:hypothetical protein